MQTTTARKTRSAAWRSAEAAFAAAFEMPEAEPAAPPARGASLPCGASPSPAAPGKRPILSLAKSRLN